MAQKLTSQLEQVTREKDDLCNEFNRNQVSESFVVYNYLGKKLTTYFISIASNQRIQQRAAQPQD